MEFWDNLMTLTSDLDPVITWPVAANEAQVFITMATGFVGYLWEQRFGVCPADLGLLIRKTWGDARKGEYLLGLHRMEAQCKRWAIKRERVTKRERRRKSANLGFAITDLDVLKKETMTLHENGEEEKRMEERATLGLIWGFEGLRADLRVAQKGLVWFVLRNTWS